MNFKKVIAGAAVTTAALAVVSVANSKTVSAVTKAPQKITVWAWDDTFNIPAVKDAAKIWGGSNIKVVSMSQDDIVQKLNTALASGNTKGLPNVVLMEDYRAQGYLKSYPKSFADLSKVVKKSDFAAYKFASTTISGKAYGVPFDSGVAGMFYRTDYLEQAGYKASDLNNITWDQFITIAKNVKDKTGHKFFSLNPSDLGTVRIIMQSAGKWYTDKNGKNDISNNDALKYGLNIYKQLINDDLVEQVSDWNGGVKAVNSGAVAGSITGSWFSSTITQAKDQSGKWAVAPVPRISGVASLEKTATNFSNLGGGGWYVIKSGNSKVDDTAKTFLKKTFASSPSLMNTLSKDIGVISTMKAASKESAYMATNDFYGGQKVVGDFSAWTQKIPSVNFGQNTYGIESILVDSEQQIIKGADINSTLKTAQQRVDAQYPNGK